VGEVEAAAVKRAKIKLVGPSAWLPKPLPLVPLIRCTLPTPCGRCWYCLQRKSGWPKLGLYQAGAK
jgi:7-cyano-7-deazaguanine synthase in queuosine biosynthesis